MLRWHSLDEVAKLLDEMAEPWHIVFDESLVSNLVKIKSISVVGGADGTSPSKMRVFINREGIDFSDAQGMQAIQEWELAENLQGVLRVPDKLKRDVVATIFYEITPNPADHKPLALALDTDFNPFIQKLVSRLHATLSMTKKGKEESFSRQRRVMEKGKEVSEFVSHSYWTKKGEEVRSVIQGIYVKCTTMEHTRCSMKDQYET
ncbi:hypothetical protein JRO89_XS09G0013800 [Xanthoceras sorbifolium]|uniref:PITH domain-containing protein n=1 Tax=Xanthoceras sorbifolium TaxID=99658 RepID=A0ABQ8HK83_9ROSI|nr:hypothetical protein JRO89_XS09G0013800 [Xanthoceras sorbifolium]